MKLATIILAAGKGTRMKSNKPKVIFKLAEKPLVKRVVETAKTINSETIAVVVGYKKEEVMSVLDDSIKFVEQKEQNGTGHAVMVTEKIFQNFKGNIFILCGDVPLLRAKTLQKMLEFHTKNKASCTVLTAIMENPAKYGRIIRNTNGDVEKIVEFKDATNEQKNIKEINTGIYCFDAESLFASLKKINNKNNQNEYYLTDTLEILNKENKLVTSSLLDDLNEATGVNSQKQLAELEMSHYNRIKNYWLENGVQIENPASVIIGENVHIKKDVFIEANVIIKGNSTIENGVRIGANSIIKNSIIKENSILKGFNIVDSINVEAFSKLDYFQSEI